ncbi:MAG: CPBP family intramembrane metalloprotease [Kiritimatiellae bacterium]|nr:CPBP family intramembrane metalloprotease [Kiritimatiellia bacterium]
MPLLHPMYLALSGSAAALADSFAPAQISGTLFALLGLYLLLMLSGVGIDLVVISRALARPLAWDRCVAWVKDRPWNWRVAGWVALILICIQLVVVGVYRMLSVLGWLRADEPESFSALIQGLVLHTASLVILALILRSRAWTWAQAFGMQAQGLVRRLGAGMALYAGILPLFFFAAVLSRLVMLIIGYPVTIQDVVLIFMEPQSLWTLLALLGLAMIVAPAAEEILFRGILLPLLMKRLGAGPAVILSSALFALIHLHVPSFFPLFVLATGLALAYIYTGSLWVPIMMHALFNGMNLAILLLATA